MTGSEILKGMASGDKRALARAISLVENETPGYEDLLQQLTLNPGTPVVGFTGPPGAGKSTLINALIQRVTGEGKTVGVVAVDPTSPFNQGALLGDRIRMSEHFENDLVFIRSLASRHSLGGLSAKTLEVTDVMNAFGFDYIFVETVGVGQSEVEIAGLADTTVLVLVPEAGDEIQTIKSGIIEIADIFVVNKSDRPGANGFAKNLLALVQEKKWNDWIPPVIQTVATTGEGCEAILEAVGKHGKRNHETYRAQHLAKKAWKLIEENRMGGVDRKELQDKIKEALSRGSVNLYALLREWGYLPG